MFDVITTVVPFHLDEHQPDHDWPLPANRMVTASFGPGLDTWGRLAGLYDRVAETVRQDVADGECPIVLSGDCTTSLGIVAGLQRAGQRPGIVWFDAHGDVQTPETTTSGYLGGMPLRLLVGYRPELIGLELGLIPVPESDVLLVGARDLDPPEVAYLAGSAIRQVPVAELTADGLPAGPLYLHLDADVVDAGELPGLLFPAPAGPSLDTVAAAVRRVLASGRVVAIGVGCTWSSRSGTADRFRPVLDSP